jgi:magnesium chelatase family protein
MTLARTWSVGLAGVTGHLVTVEADLSAGLPGTAVIGLPDPAIIQSRDRIRAAILNSGHKWPDRRITLALSPAGRRADRRPGPSCRWPSVLDSPDVSVDRT